MNQPNIPHHHERRPTDYPTRKPPKYGWRDDTGQPIHDIDVEGNPICGRRCSRTKQPCQRTGSFLSANGRCCTVGHGGKAPGAPPIHGRFSIFLPSRLANSYLEAIEDDVLINVREHMAITAALIEEKLNGLAEKSSAERWTEARAASAQVRAAALSQNLPSLILALDRLDAILANGEGQRQCEKDLQSLMATSAKLAKVELARMEKVGEYFTRQDRAAAVAKIMSVLRKHADESTIAKVGEGLSEFTLYRGYPRRQLSQSENSEQQLLP